MELQINGNKIFAPLKNKELVLTPEESSSGIHLPAC